MVTKRDKIIQELRDLIATLEKEGISIRRAYLFGSYARGNPKKWSDIDLLLVSDNFSGIRFYDIEKLIPLTRKFNKFIELHPLKTEDFNLKDLFIKEITKTGIRIK
ncbi:MAG: nucleotidyltransferase domain-containing protein [Caldiserica bacterium]|nr:nucleotidyltransferase domain-containing protein [Caldisericota bacterium]